jgi:phage terminase large subunit GpA-like protein
LTTGEGYWLDVSWARTNFWGDNRKVLDFGTPTTYDKSEIWTAYMYGDRRKFLLPCPMCGTFQELEFGSDKSQHGVKPVYKAGELVDAVYMCEHCHDGIKNTQKGKMMREGYWKASAKSSEPQWVSRHWNSCYSPAMRWKDLWAHYERAKEKPDGMRSFTNLYEGLPYKETGTRISAQRLISLKSTYLSGEVPDGTLFTTVGADVQQGKRNDPKNPPRIELEVCGHGKKYRTWSIKYLRIEGSVDNAFEGAWQELFELIQRKELTFKNAMGHPFPPARILIDSGFKTHVVYAFVQRLKGVFACKGQGMDFEPDQELDQRKKNSDFRYKTSKTVDGHRMFIIATTEYKRIMRAALRVTRQEMGKDQDPMFCEFPSDYNVVYFNMLNAEEMLEDGSFDAGGRANEATDCRVYNMCAGESYLVDAVESVRNGMRALGYAERACEAITKDHILMKLEQKICNAQP